MKIRYVEILLTIFILSFLLYLINRYIILNQSISNVLQFSLYFLLGLFFLILSRLSFKNIINPISSYSFFIFLFSFSFIIISSAQHCLSNYSIFLINVAIVAHLIGAMIKLNFKPFAFFYLTKSTVKYILISIVIVGFITSLGESFIIGYIPIFNIFSKSVYGDTLGKFIPLLHYVITLNFFVPAWLFILFKEKIIKKRLIYLLLPISIYIMLNVFGRQMYLLFLLSLIFAYNYYYKINKVKLFFIIISFISFFILIGSLRENSNRDYGSVIRYVAGIKDSRVSSTEAFLYLYSSKSFNVFDDLVKDSNEDSFRGYGYYFTKPITSFFLLQKLQVINVPDKYDTLNRIPTYVIDSYLDYGVIGIIIFGVIFGVISRRFYYQYNNEFIEGIVSWSIIVFCIFMMIFINYFNTIFIWLGLAVNKLLFSYKK